MDPELDELRKTAPSHPWRGVRRRVANERASLETRIEHLTKSNGKGHNRRVETSAAWGEHDAAAARGGEKKRTRPAPNFAFECGAQYVIDDKAGGSRASAEPADVGNQRALWAARKARHPSWLCFSFILKKLPTSFFRDPF